MLSVAMPLLALGLVLAAKLLPSANPPPGSSSSPPPVTSVVRTPDITYAEVDGLSLKLDAYLPQPLPKPAPPVLIHIHGGGWSGGDKGQGAEMYELACRSGYAVFSINYRLSQTAPYPAQIHDCKAAVRWVRAHAADFGADGSCIGVFGESAGGHLAALLGCTAGDAVLEGSIGLTTGSSAVQAVCDWFGPTDLRRLPGLPEDARGIVIQLLGAAPESVPELARLASPVCFCDADDAPFLIIHGTDDPLVPYSQSVDLYNALRAAGAEAEIIAVPGAGHGGFVGTSPDVEELAARMLAFFDARLK